MAKAKRNLTQLRKDNRTSTMPLKCSTPHCDNDFYVARYSRTKYPHKKVCVSCFNNPPQNKRTQQQIKTTNMLRSLGLIA